MLKILELMKFYDFHFSGILRAHALKWDGGVGVMTPVVVPEKSNIVYDLSQSFLVGVWLYLEREMRDIDNREMHVPGFTEIFHDKT